MTMKISVDSAKLAAARRESGLTYEEISERSGGRWPEYTVRRLLRLPRINENDAIDLCSIIGCNLDDVVPESYRRELTLPFDILRSVEGLYHEAKDSFDPTYRRIFRSHKAEKGFQNLLEQAGHLYEIFTRPDYEDSPDLTIESAIEKILTSFGLTGTLASERTILNRHSLEWLLGQIEALRHDTETTRAALVFVYSLLVLSSLLMEEMVVATMLLSPYRKQDVVEAYYNLAISLEGLLKSFFDEIVHSPETFRAERCNAYRLDVVLFDATVCIIAALQRVVRHHDSPNAASQYLNRKVLDGLVQRLLATAEFFDLEVCTTPFSDFESTSFGTRYIGLRLLSAQFSGKSRRAQTSVDPGTLAMAFYFGQNLGSGSQGDAPK